MQCRKCKTKWPHDSEQSISVELNGNCLNCRKAKLTRSDIDAILVEHAERRNRNMGVHDGRIN